MNLGKYSFGVINVVVYGLLLFLMACSQEKKVDAKKLVLDLIQTTDAQSAKTINVQVFAYTNNRLYEVTTTTEFNQLIDPNNRYFYRANNPYPFLIRVNKLPDQGTFTFSKATIGNWAYEVNSKYSLYQNQLLERRIRKIDKGGKVIEMVERTFSKSLDSVIRFRETALAYSKNGNPTASRLVYYAAQDSMTILRSYSYDSLDRLVKSKEQFLPDTISYPLYSATYYQDKTPFCLSPYQLEFVGHKGADYLIKDEMSYYGGQLMKEVHHLNVEVDANTKVIALTKQLKMQDGTGKIAVKRQNLSFSYKELNPDGTTN